MFSEDTAAVLVQVKFKTETVDEEVHRVCELSFKLSPLTHAQAAELNIASVLFDATTGTVKQAIASVVALVSAPDQQLAIARMPGVTPYITLPTVRIEDKLRAKTQHDREPLVLDAVLVVSCLYPDADTLLALASAVNEGVYLSFSPSQLDLLTTVTAEDDHEPIRHRSSPGPARVN